MVQKRKLSAERTFVAKDKEYLDPKKREELERHVKSLEANARNIDNVIDSSKPWLYNPKSTNINDLRRQIAKTKKTIAKRTPPEVDSKTKNSLLRRAKALETEIRKEMPTFDEMMGKRHLGADGKPYVISTEFAIRKQMSWQSLQANNIREWKQIMRILDPHDPNVTNVERLRRN